MILTSKNIVQTKKKWNLSVILSPWLVPLAIVGIWQIISSLKLVAQHILPAPTQIIATFWLLLSNGDLLNHLIVSGERVLVGFLLGASVGIVLGIVTGFSKLLQEIVDPSLQMLRTVPLLALIPLFILWFGVGEFGKVLMIALGAFFPVYVNVFLGIRLVNIQLYEVTGLLQYSFKKRLTTLIIPSAMPNILLGIRLALGASWLVLVVSEMMGTSAGIGYMIQDARAYSQTDIVFVGLVMFALLGKLSDSFVYTIERRVLKWQDTFKG
ncbi:ABC transporter permease [Lysinibacillus piscis]|uniref:Aliphatic sulfonates transport permease protein SsuC n=1 Tax=Lysinibacillus piscis TaxID=2518931 RepID=A0ABQ5NHQ9_9BACI|nr:ABC transporter permease [Lysinibacillus sp. KH24]GLC87633.1 putative aliphatic sulfonates transport permease protein SsuC [Lysinibacillus sp. KH24]